MQDGAYLREKAVNNCTPAVFLFVFTWHPCVSQVFERPSFIASKSILFIKGKNVD